MANCNRFVIKIVCFLLIICMIATLFIGCSSKQNINSSYRSISEILIDTQVLAKNGNYELKWDKEGKNVIYSNRENGSFWSDILYDSFKEGSTSANGNSPISITVTNVKTLQMDTVTSYSAMDTNGNIVCKKIPNGWNHLKLGIYFFGSIRKKIKTENLDTF